ncbi:quinone oxidoreductase family protein [Bifidobacterium crudilactis]|jgi:NADPH:quinone reductase-like Zn-dependent oxidoreductase|uniref:Zinc-binding dehydrogenase n=1 Tax=Bifidobacterium crudilactis TaxID=327277 RepID=A0A971CZ50_9BIFI|nr:zinc-binding dehydrogenase [Bifidobacterium crudilactis]MDN5972383.1 zinc-binding dehydrogenase [Bifidobacterium crudilactis]MDN6000466.1 zinc-binding dehydrogenase [Bifidobacterium crudilactis]MDN6208754.1 zinc-binding dehydrogenase [Bifidobacterium crudilactis]MDN6234105.1 zinc-binding dehydrogenase [Bifidobacterium crudilactis]MDN6424230.1 zinc-binding dehydrogenase [Bifidobacterium crudilactis]
MNTMKAYATHPDSTTVSLEEVPIPQPHGEEILVRVHAAALNNGDLAAAKDRSIPGFEFAGEVVNAADQAGEELVGKRVAGIAEGSFAEYVVAHCSHVLIIPDSLAYAHAAALPTALSTEYGALRSAGLEVGDSVLVTAATSGIASHGVQVAKALGAGDVIGTTRSNERREYITATGADHAIVTSKDGWVEDVQRLTEGGADIVLDHVAGDFLNQAIQAARDGGSVVSVGRLSGSSADIDLFALAHRHVTLRSVSYGLNPPSILGDLLRGVQVELMPSVAAGQIRPLVDSTYSFGQLPEALEKLGSGSAHGKVTISE